MDDSLTPELELVAALRLTAAPPQAWIDAAAMLPATLGELEEVERVLASPDFQTAFARDPERALADVGLPASPPVVSALQERLAGD
jgi:hypothetical protein